jgi:hypothetical protein
MTMALQRITALAKPPMVGKAYLVPVVEYEWYGFSHEWPVFPFRHEDGEFLAFPYFHFHLDPRFMNKWQWKHAASFSDFMSRREGVAPFISTQRSPLCSRGIEVPADFTWARRTCQRAEIPYYFREVIDSKLTPAFAGQQCAKARTGWVCPHKHFPLGQIPAEDRVITCPLHGLRIDVDTGVVLSPP